MSATDRITEIRTRLNAAGPGPRGDGEAGYIVKPDGSAEEHWKVMGEVYGPVRVTADLLAHLPADLEWLLDHLEAMEARAVAAEVRLEREKARTDLMRAYSQAAWDHYCGRGCCQSRVRDAMEDAHVEPDRPIRRPRIRATPPAGFDTRAPFVMYDE